MNRNQRRLGRMHQRKYSDYEERKERQESLERQESQRRHDLAEKQERTLWQGRAERQLRSRELDKYRHNNRSTDIKEVLPPRGRRTHKFTTNKCCYIAPKQQDFGQLTDTEIEEPVDKYQTILKEQYGFDPLWTEPINQLKELSKVLCDTGCQVESSTQSISDKKLSAPNFEVHVHGSQWQNIDNADEIDEYLKSSEAKGQYLPEDIHISEIPRLKVIVKKFSRYKKNDVELRRLEEKVVCVEYDVSFGDEAKPVETLRAFFAIKPASEANFERAQTNDIPSKIKNNFNISNEDFKKLNEKEIEIIDGKIAENKTYLEDLKRILKRKQTIWAKKNKTSLDLMSLYEMAKRESPSLDEEYSGANLLSTAELQEIKDFILNKCASSVQGISRRTLKQDPIVDSVGPDVISQSILAELVKETSIVVE